MGHIGTRCLKTQRGQAVTSFMKRGVVSPAHGGSSVRFLGVDRRAFGAGGPACFSFGRSGVSLVEAQMLARHCDPKMIANHYTHLSLHDLASAVSRLVAPRTTDRGREAMRATGSDEILAKSLSPSVAPNLAQTGDNRGETLTTAENSPVAKFDANRRPPEMQKPRKFRGFEHVCESLTTPEKSTEGGSRTHTPSEGYGILNPARLPFRHSGSL